jgi:MOSC domain-containing protein YiiM
VARRDGDDFHLQGLGVRPVQVGRLNLVGDRQSDLTVHGGADKAVYLYPSEHYAYWRQELERPILACGAFGENLTSESSLEDAVHIGDRLQIGTAVLSVTQPRLPCAKLAIAFSRPDMPKRFLRSGRTRFYLKVSQEGEATAGDPVTIISRDAHAITVADIVGLYAIKGADRDLLRRASELPALPEPWRDYFRKRHSHVI